MSTETVDIDRYLSHSAQIPTDDLDWELAQRANLNVPEKFILTYFSDIEGQTIYYLRDLLNTKVSRDPDSVAFLTMWNYEEFFHGRVLSRLLMACGVPVADDRKTHVRLSARISEKLLGRASKWISKLFPDAFLALYMTWGAVNELTTLRGYERLMKATSNPVLQTLADRIALQERRHFAWYFNNARERLLASPFSRWFTKTLLNRFWTPVGVGVKSIEEATRLVRLLFPEKEGIRMADDIDGRISSLPGLSGLGIMKRFLSRPAL